MWQKINIINFIYYLFNKINIRIDKIDHEDHPLQIYSNHDAKRKLSASRPYFASTLHVIRNQVYRRSKATVPGNLQDRKRLDGCYQGSKQLALRHMYGLQVFSYASLLAFPVLHLNKGINYIFYINYIYIYYCLLIIYFKNKTIQDICY